MPAKNKLERTRGFTLIEILISIFLFGIIAVGVLGAYAALTRSAKVAREKTILASLTTNYLEIVKNMPYSQVGTKNGNPNGPLADFSSPISTTIEAYNYKIYYEVTYIDDPADNSSPFDTAPNDYKQVKMKIENQTTNQLTTFVTNIVPKGLEISTGGALKVSVINANGQPVAGASIHIESTSTLPNINLDRVSDSNGELLELDLPAKVNGYHIVVTKAGYTTDQTYPLSTSNPNPIKPDATIALGLVTQVTFAIDLVSTLNIRTVNSLCQNVNGVNLNVRGAKLIGTTPDVLKFDQSFSSVAGLIALNNLEWDTYTPALLTGQSWVVAGTSPVQKIDVSPGAVHVFTMILNTNSTDYSLLVIVKDSATNAALEGATVHLRKGGSTPQDYYGTSGGSVWVQTDWTGGAGQANWSTTTPDRYWLAGDDIDINSAPTGVRLRKYSGNYAPSSHLESSTFDTGAGTTNFTSLTWEPPSQSASTTLEFQLASNNDNATWNYIGPDGTAGTYYTVPGAAISSAHDNTQYIRYKAYLATTNDKKTPVLTSININYVSGCATPGQVWFPDLTQGNNYDLDVSLAGYTTYVEPNITIGGHVLWEVPLSP